MNIVIIISIIAALIIGIGVGYILFRYVIKGMYTDMIAAAEKESEVMKRDKLLEVKAKYLNKKNELEKETQQRNQKLQQNEQRLKQREQSLNQKQN